MGQSLSEFTDFVNATGGMYMQGPDMIVNDTSLRNYAAHDILIRSKREKQGGANINANIILDSSNRATHYKPGDVAVIENTNYLTKMTLEWRFTRIDVSYNEKEIMLNAGAGRDARFQQYTDVMKSKQAGAATDIIGKIERSLVLAATTDMETTTGTTPYSIFATVTSDGLAPSGYTNVQNINPTTKTNWRNQNTTYTAGSFLDPDIGLIGGFDTMSELVKFKAPSWSKKHFQDTELQQMVVLTNKEGRNDFRKAIRANNDITRVGQQDPAYPDPVFNGISVRACEGFDDRTAFASGSPSYLFINGKYLSIVCRTNKWMDMTKDFTPHNQPDTVVFYYDCWWNLVNESRRRHGYLLAA
jgi:hypothetical protein